MFYGLLHLSFWGYVIAVLLMTHLTIVSVTLFLHRSQAHRSLDLHPVLSHLFRFWLWMTTGMETKAWTAIHRKHHAKCETVDDPHSPQIKGLSKVLWEGSELYRAEAKNQETLDRYGYGTPDDWLEKHVYSPHSAKGILLMLFIDLLLFGVPGITVWVVQMVWIPFLGAGFINGVGHYWGYRNFECPDAARNIVPIAILIGGEELHNNHHTYPTSAKLSCKWWEFDIGWFYIRLFSPFGLVRVKRALPKPYLQPGKLTIDMETVKAVFANRFQVMARYSREVITPVFREEKRRASNAGKRLLRQARALLIREESLVSHVNKQRLGKVLADVENLRLVYHYRMKLQEIWNSSTATPKELLEALQEWCKQAESTSIEVLKHFAEQLKAYGLQRAHECD